MPLHVENLVDNASLPYGLALLRGTVSPVSQFQHSSVRVRVVPPSQTGTREASSVAETAWPVINGRFEAFVTLAMGVNVVQLQCDCLKHQMRLVRRSRADINHCVLPLYVVCADDDGSFQAPPGMESSTAAAGDRIRLAARMLQMFVAETLYAEGLERRTFRLAGEESGCVECRTFRTKLRRNEAQAMTGKQLWQYLGCELVTAYPSEKDRCKFLAFVSFTEYKNPDGVIPKNHYAVLALTKGHTALGGGGLALFGTGCLYTWPRHVSEIVSCFTDTCRVDVGHFMDDSAGRGTHWACYSTSLGAVCHELGHTFDLGHDPEGIMARGFDDMVHFFVFPELFQYLTSGKTILKDDAAAYLLSTGTDENSNLEHSVQSVFFNSSAQVQQSSVNNSEHGQAFWHRPSSIILAYHRWLNSATTKDASLPHIDGFTVTSSNPLRIVQLRNLNGLTISFCEFPESQADVFTFNLSSMLNRNKYQEPIVIVVVEDTSGNLIKITQDIGKVIKNCSSKS